MIDILQPPDAADFQVQSGDRPTGQSGGWWWNDPLNRPPSATAWDPAEDRSKTWDIFLAGILLGIAGAALVAGIQVSLEIVSGGSATD
jgi:hypothetical protein